jgi:prepilin-type N-terminal cleavage/methylation domain-containing protein
MRSHPLPATVRRPAFTLMELLVVIGLIVVIAGIGLLTVPLMQSQQKASSNASQLVAWFGDAKAIALRDRRPTGLRFVPDPNNPGFIREVFLIQTPDDFTGGTVQITNPLTPNIVSVAGADFYGGFGQNDVLDHPVQVGDFLELNGGGLLYFIAGVSQTTAPPNVVSTLQTLPTRPVALTSATPNYRVIRQPRRMQGEDSFTFTGNVAIDLSLSQGLPVRTVTVNNATPPATESYYEVVFAPSGGVVGKGTVASDKIILWVRDSTTTKATDHDPALVTVQVRTGFLGTYQVDTVSTDPYSYARDPRAGGM